MTNIFAFQTEAIDSTGLSLLRKVLDKWCLETDHDIYGSEAAEAAAELVSWYQFGLKNEQQLLEMLNRG
ncbi:hypothetical protein [Pararhizobium sp. PWRC1-1]|uniref:hypothetical protein n=1 Tax=Pararhizobium sp. PWRC1-1 TaxID=2804566 RepID=UPI003CF9A844